METEHVALLSTRACECDAPTFKCYRPEEQQKATELLIHRPIRSAMTDGLDHYPLLT